MDFFESQEAARRKTRTLVFYFVLAVAGVILSVYAAALAGSLWLEGPSPGAIPWWDPDIFLWSSLGTLAVILLGTGFKTMQLSAGGASVAKELGGRRLDPDSGDFDERKLLNVVEEMAIASGVPAPEVFVLEDEDGVNAFAAGMTPSDAVIGVTRGCMKILSRDELQGVIAHEFSHILNGDMRLNLRLIGLLHGILLLAIIGRVILQSLRHARFSRSRGKGGGGVILVVLGGGLALLIIGSIGVFFGKLIKAAVSRQREFLADASAVQFTRNPGGIGGALMVIGGLARGSRIGHPRAEEASHMYFANGLRASLSAAFSTHPPLDARILKILPSWDGVFPVVRLPEISGGSRAAKVAAVPVKRADRQAARAAAGTVSAAAALESVGQIEQEQVEEARRIREELPEDWIETLRRPSGAQALVFALLLSPEDERRAAETRFLEEAIDFVTLGETMRLRGEVAKLDSSRKIALIDLAIPALRRLSREEYERFESIMERLMAGDDRIDLFEFMLERLVKRHLRFHFGDARPPRIAFHKLASLSGELALLLSTLAYLGHREDRAAAEAAYGAVMAELAADLGGAAPAMLDPSECVLDAIGAALGRWDAAAPLLKRRLLQACAKSVTTDGEIRSEEAELFRAIADAIGCPIPPFVRT